MEPENSLPMESLGGIDSEPTPPPLRKNSMPAGVVVPQLPRNISQGVGSVQYFADPAMSANLPVVATSAMHHPRYGITTNSTSSNHQAGVHAISSEYILQSPSTHRRAVASANNAKFTGQSSGMPSKSKSMTSPSLPRAVLASSPPDTRSMMHTAAPRLAPDAPTSPNAAPAVSSKHPSAATGYGGATESIYPSAADHSAHYPAYNQRGLVKSNSVDIYRLSESPNHAHATANLPVSNAFPPYGSPNEAVTLACSVAPAPPQYYDPRMTTASDAKGLVYYAAAMVPAHQPTSMAYVTTSVAPVAHPAFVMAPASVSVAAAEYGVASLNPADYYVTTAAASPGAGMF